MFFTNEKHYILIMSDMPADIVNHTKNILDWMMRKPGNEWQYNVKGIFFVLFFSETDC